MSITNTVFSIFSFIGFILVLLAAPWRLQAWNIGVCLYIGWTASGLLCLFVNSILWRDNVTNWAPVYCDIATRINIGLGAGIPASLLVINRRLYRISSPQTLLVDSSSNLNIRIIMVDLSIGLGIPVLMMILQYVVQDTRFIIFEELGCFPALLNVPPAYALIICPPVVVSLVSGYYSIRNILNLHNRHAEIKEVMSFNSNSSLNFSIFYRLMALGVVELICSVPFTLTFVIIDIVKNGVFPWVSWDNVHSHISQINTIPKAIWRKELAGTLNELNRWIVVIAAFIFFAFFGFSSEAREHYKIMAKFIAKCCVGYTPSPAPKRSEIIFKGFKSTMSGSLNIEDAPAFASQNAVPVKHFNSLEIVDQIVDLPSRKDIEANLDPSSTSIDNSTGSQEIKLPSLVHFNSPSLSGE